MNEAIPAGIRGDLIKNVGTLLDNPNNNATLRRLTYGDIVTKHELGEAYQEELQWFNICHACRDVYHDMLTKSNDLATFIEDEDIPDTPSAARAMLDKLRDVKWIPYIENKSARRKYNTWLIEIEHSAIRLKLLRELVDDKYLTYTLGGEINDCHDIDLEAYNLTKKWNIVTMLGHEMIEPLGTEKDPDIPVCHWRKGIYEPVSYSRSLDGKQYWIPNIRVKVSPTCLIDPLGVPENWKPLQVMDQFTTYLQEPDYSKGVKVPITYVKTAWVKVNGKLKLVEYPMGKGEKLECPSKKIYESRCYTIIEKYTLKEIKGSMINLKYNVAKDINDEYSSVSVSDGIIDESNSDLSTGIVVFSTLPTNTVFTVTYIASKRPLSKVITYVKEGGIDFRGSMQLYAPKGLAYNDKYCLNYGILTDNDWAYNLQKRFMHELFFGSVNVITAVEKASCEGMKPIRKRQAWKRMPVKLKHGTKTITKYVVVFCDLRKQ